MTTSVSTTDPSPGTFCDVPGWVQAALRPFLQARGVETAQPPITGWSFSSRYFSSILEFELVERNGIHQRYLAKFPKAAKGRCYAFLPRREAADLLLAAKEHEALLHLARWWPSGITGFIQPAFFDPATGMLVFPFVDGQDLHRGGVVRSLLLRRPLPSDWMGAQVALGGDLARYHEATAREGSFALGEAAARLWALATRAGFNESISPIEGRRETQCVIVETLKGFEIRNARRSGTKLWLYDPGRLKLEPPEADVARYLVSLRMLHWGTAFFVLPLETQPVEEVFIEAYRSVRPFDSRLLAFFVQRELLKNWLFGQESARLKRGPASFRRFQERLYVDVGYRRILRTHSRRAGAS